MTFRRFPRTAPPRQPSRRDLRNHLAAYDALYAGSSTVPVLEPAKPRTTPKRQRESKVNDAVKEWAKYRGGVLYRNSKAFVVLPSGHRCKAGIGPNGFGDLVGYLTIQITPAMVGRQVAVFTMVESKTDTGVLEDHQQALIQEVKAAGGIAGCCRNAADAEVMLATWGARKL